jgi:hypothetical protein
MHVFRRGCFANEIGASHDTLCFEVIGAGKLASTQTRFNTAEKAIPRVGRYGSGAGECRDGAAKAAMPLVPRFVDVVQLPHNPLLVLLSL